MVALNESSIFEEIIRRIETTDPVMGGEPNPATGQAPPNIALMQLANRTRWLFDLIEEMYTNGEIDAAISAAVGVLTAAELLTRIKTVDGAGSGLDADLLDGLHASAFWKDADAPRDFANPGYQVLPSGFIVMGGRSAVIPAGGSITVTYPTAFPNAAISTVAVDYGGGNESSVMTVTHLSASGFTLGTASTSNTSANWMAIGH